MQDISNDKWGVKYFSFTIQKDWWCNNCLKIIITMTGGKELLCNC